jgi:hypothetical protein
MIGDKEDDENEEFLSQPTERDLALSVPSSRESSGAKILEGFYKKQEEISVQLAQLGGRIEELSRFRSADRESRISVQLAQLGGRIEELSRFRSADRESSEQSKLTRGSLITKGVRALIA